MGSEGLDVVVGDLGEALGERAGDSIALLAGAFALDGADRLDVLADQFGRHVGAVHVVEQAAEAFFVWRAVRPVTGQVLADLRAKLAA